MSSHGNTQPFPNIPSDLNLNDATSTRCQQPVLALDTGSLTRNAHRPDSSSSSARVSPFTPALRRRAATFRTVSDYDEFEMRQPGWEPGAEPGFDPSKPDGGHASMPTLSALCVITVVDFSQERIERQVFQNDAFIRFLKEPQPKWSKCRWINVNGLSWDVIQAVGQAKGLHKLALEDIMDLKNRPKAEWYPNHAFVILTLQKLVHLVDPDESDSSSSSDSDFDDDAASTWSKIKRPFRFRKKNRKDSESTPNQFNHQVRSNLTREEIASPSAIGKTLQQYHASPNEARTEFMEQHSSLAGRSLAVSAEQVSLFLTSDNTIISFFEVSADDIERPIIKRLGSPGTMLRQLCDASMVMQAVIDAMIDLAIPLTDIYTDVISDLELDVLTNPSIRLSRALYIIISEMNKMLSFFQPIDNIINVLRDHKTEMPHQTESLQDPTTGIIISQNTAIYLGDVLDHCGIVTESMQQVRQSAQNLIDLIFNITSANQNEVMKQLTIITIIFLPLTFITGFFGQNFQPFPQLDKGITYFWEVSVPTVFATAILIMFSGLRDYFNTLFQRRRIWWMRKAKQRRREKRIKRRQRREKRMLARLS
ncbi:hypothetical protein TD95_002026 [Thielaviopsis punctulata]|uniref:Magnesium transport protein CorA n=1 Tax=Thielaviopsis punctulata TaxID=72032 RepID=A0A0F4ZC22_9PEZI|nr:hypothetical protein TD95_002026 [Thielaviopsis punctulata]